ncbi:uncharacterized protein At4g04775-like [Capsella rubella]|uniref:uncharacterized protein At4g04775-like n=1 Tax=Capsella rubella TaxID=81985 RepID=UPI000CD51791|nr:uncharacterized protein At4g04775-like [Capsella rubella]XP_023632738.1 uncharacterized protein At4g04775-like [Capsella rubella]
MGQDYSYSWDSSNEQSHHYTEDIVDMEIEAYILMDEGHSAYNMVDRTEPEIEVGFPNLCYCGGQPLLKTSYTRNDPRRKYFTCENVGDGNMHFHKWWDVAVIEEMTERSRVVVVDLKEMIEQEGKSEEKVVKLQKLVEKLGDELQRNRVTLRMVFGVSFCVLALLISIVGLSRM